MGPVSTSPERFMVELENLLDLKKLFGFVCYCHSIVGSALSALLLVALMISLVIVVPVVSI
jgi:hypothetical protein